MKHRLFCLAKGCLAVLGAWFALLATARVPVAFSDRAVDTVGRIHHCGLPIPWRTVAPGLAWADVSWWALPVDIAFWTLLSCFLFRVRTWSGRALCLALAEAALLVFLP